MFRTQQSKIEAKALSLYRQRLQNLPKIVADLYDIVKNDEAIKLMKSENLEKYRFERVDEIVREVFNSEKQRMLIHVLQKYQDLSAKYEQLKKQGQPLKPEQDLTGKLEALQAIIKIKDKQILAYESTNKEQNNRLKKLSEKRECSQCFKKTQQIVKFQTLLKQSQDFNQKLKKDGEYAVSNLKQKIKVLENSREQDKEELENNNRIISNLRQNLQTLKYEQEEKKNAKNINLKTQKIENIKNNVNNLEQQLFQLIQKFHTMQQNVGNSLRYEIRQLREIQERLKSSMQKQLNRFKTQVLKQIGQQFFVKIQQHILIEARGNDNEERISKKMNQINNQIDYFLEHEMIM